MPTWRSKSKSCGKKVQYGARTRRATIRMIVIQMRDLRMKKTWQKRPYASRASARKSLLKILLPIGKTLMLKMVMKMVLNRKERRHANPVMMMSVQMMIMLHLRRNWAISSLSRTTTPIIIKIPRS